MPYYISRFILSFGFSLLVLGITWGAGLFAALLFSGFLFYLHGGWFRVDPSLPLFPLRRDAHGREIQRKALIAAVFCGLAVSVGSSLFLPAAQAEAGVLSGLGISAAVLGYFLTQTVLYFKAQ